MCLVGGREGLEYRDAGKLRSGLMVDLDSLE